MDFQNYLVYGYIALFVAIFLVFLIFSYYLKYLFVSKKSDRKLKDAEINYKYVVLIPARSEYKVINHIFESLKNQTYPKELFKVFVITERENDKSNELALENGFNYIVRKDLNNKRTKGYALKEGYNYLIENNIEFDSLIIFDADNRIDKNYIYELNKLKNEGHQIGVGKRLSTNVNSNFVSASSSLLFAFQSEFTNKARTTLFNKFAISGTGYYIDKKIIEDAGGRNFLGLTEDVELTRYAYKTGIDMGYNPNAIFYDEQPLDLVTMHKQHVRWIWGYFNKESFEFSKKATKKYSKVPFLARFEYILAMGLFISIEFVFTLHLLYSFIMSIISYTEGAIYFGNLFLGLFFLDIFLMFFICSLVNDIELFIIRKKFNCSKKAKLYICTTGFIFWSDFLWALLDGLIHPSKRKTWEKIRHKGHLDNQGDE